MLSSDIQKRLEQAKASETTYRPNEEVCKKLADKTFVMFVSPVAVGKSFLMNHIAENEPEFSRVSVFTTRKPRQDDEPGMFHYIPHDDQHLAALLGQIERGEVVQYVVHPTTGNIYGSALEDHKNIFNMLPTLSITVDLLLTLPFKKIVVIGLAAEPNIWKQRIDARYPIHNAERTKRLEEARVSLDWLLSSPHVKWVDNTISDTSAARQTVINIVKYNQDGDKIARQHAEEMREMLETDL